MSHQLRSSNFFQNSLWPWHNLWGNSSQWVLQLLPCCILLSLDLWYHQRIQDATLPLQTCSSLHQCSGDFPGSSQYHKVHNTQVNRSGLWVGAVNTPLTNSLSWGWVRRLALSPNFFLGLLLQLLTLMPTLVLWMSTLARRSLPILFWPKNFFRNLVLYLRLSPQTPHCQALRFSRSGESSQVQRSMRPALHALAKEWVRAAEDTA